MLVCLSASHKDAGLRTVERIAGLDTSTLPQRLCEREGVNGVVMVSTCNRFELYLDVDALVAPRSRSLVEPLLAELGEPRPEELGLEQLDGRRATEHLFAVSAGLESVVVGEAEIAGQVRRSLSTARDQGTTTTTLERLFQRASRAQRGVKTRTGLGEAGRSLVRLALDLASGRVQDWAQTSVLLVGTGRFAAVSLAALRDRGVRQISVWSPSGRGAEFAAKHEITTVPRGGAALAMARADLIVTCTGATGHVVTPQRLVRGRGRLAGELVNRRRLEPVPAAPAPIRGCPIGHHGAPVVLDARADRPVSDATPAADEAQCPVLLTATDRVEHPTPSRQLVIDLGMPRNVDPQVSLVPGVELLDLETISLHAPLEHLTATEDARAVVAEAVDSFERSGREEQIAPAVTALRGHVQAALQAELDRVGRHADEQTREAVEQALRHFAGVVMHRPTVRARELAAEGEHDRVVDAVVALFGAQA